MSNTIQIKHGEQVPQASQLANFELGYCTGDGKLYFNANGTIKSFLPNIENGFSLLETFPITTIGEDESGNTYTLDLIKRSFGSILIGDPNTDLAQYQKGIDFYIGDGYNLTVGRVDSTGVVNSKIFDEYSILGGFTLNNNKYIYSFLKDDDTTKVGLIGRNNSNNIWIGSASTTSQGNAYICVGKGPTGSAKSNLYVVRTHFTSKDSQDGDNRYIVYDNYSIRDGFTLNNGTQLYAYLKDGTKERLIQRNTSNNVWIGGSTSSDGTKIGGVYLAVGDEQYVSILKGGEYYRVLDYQYVGKELWNGAEDLAVGSSITVPGIKNYRFFLVQTASSNSTMFLIRRGNYYRGGVLWGDGGVHMEGIYFTGNSSNETIKYEDHGAYKITTSGITAETGDKKLVAIWGIV